MAPRIEELHSLPELTAAALVGADGLLLAGTGDGAELLAAELAGLQVTLERLSRRLGAGEVSHLALTTPTLEIVALSREGYTLGAALRRGVDTAAARQHLAALIEDLPQQLPAQDVPASAEGAAE